MTREIPDRAQGAFGSRGDCSGIPTGRSVKSLTLLGRSACSRRPPREGMWFESEAALAEASEPEPLPTKGLSDGQRRLWIFAAESGARLIPGVATGIPPPDLALAAAFHSEGTVMPTVEFPRAMIFEPRLDASSRRLLCARWLPLMAGCRTTQTGRQPSMTAVGPKTLSRRRGSPGRAVAGPTKLQSVLLLAVSEGWLSAFQNFNDRGFDHR